ncbi:MAG: DpnD/PcfM family protein [bacterium]|nr:DpnD/PcfM family protein [bacterium]
MKYKIIIEETISQEFEVEANSLEEAQSKAIDEYNNGNIVLEPGELQSKQIKVIDENNKELEWKEF